MRIAFGKPRSEEEPLPSQDLVEAALRGDVEFVAGDVELETVTYLNGLGAVKLRVRSGELVLKEEGPVQVRTEWIKIKTEVTALFAAAHSGHVDVVRILLEAGVDVNVKLFRGYAITAAAREGHITILEMLLESGASPDSCEEALIEASLFGQSQACELLISSELVGPRAASHAIVIASSRGFVDVVGVLIKNGIDVNCTDRILLQSLKPSLHANVDCTPLIAAIITRQISTVQCLLQAGANTETLVRVGAWTWDPKTGEEIRVGSCLGEPYNSAFCAVEYYESTGQILTLILKRNPNLLETPHFGRTLLCHAILCQNPNAVSSLIQFGANPKFPIQTSCHEFFPIHLASRLGNVEIIKVLVTLGGADLDVRNSNGDTPLMVSARFGKVDLFLELIKFGADLGLVNKIGYTAVGIANSSGLFAMPISEIITKVLDLGAKIKSSDNNVFSPLHFVARDCHAGPLQTMILNSSLEELNWVDKSGFTPLMAALTERKEENFRLLVMAGADLKARTLDGDSAMSLIRKMDASSRDCFEEILLKAALANVLDLDAFNAVHYAAKKGDNGSLIQLLKMGYDADNLDCEGYSPLMHATLEGNFETCKVLLSKGAKCNFENDRGESALILARESGKISKVIMEGILLDDMAKNHVIQGEQLFKYTRAGRGPRHVRFLRVSKSGLATWGKGSRRKVYCREAIEGPGSKFAKIRRGGEDEGKMVIFRVVTLSGREVYFEASSSSSLELWVRGINLILKENSSKVN